MNPFQNMNLFQNANVAARFFIFAGLAVGIVEALKLRSSGTFTLPNQEISIVLLCIFIISFNVKATIDDHHYFEMRWEIHPVLRYSGFVLAVFSWIFFGVAAVLVYNPVDAAQMLGLSFLVSTAWIAVHIIEITLDKGRRNQEIVISLMREKWLIINILYLICLVVYLGWLDPVIPAYRWWVLAILLVVFAYDIATSRPIVKTGERS